jgi:hypothetical protein
LQTDDLLKLRFTTVAERQDACLELRKNFDGQELRSFETLRALAGGAFPSIGASAQLTQPLRPKLQSDKPAEHLFASGRQQCLHVIVCEVGEDHVCTVDRGRR